MTIFKASRALTVRSAAIPEVSGAPALVPLKLQGREGINSLFHYTLALQTPDALQFSGIGSNFRLDDFIGREITCSIELEGMGSFQAGMPGGLGASHQGAGVREISGLITAARFCTEDHRHAIYELEIRPWLYLATLTTDCKVFQDKTPVEVIEAVLAGYNFASDKRLIETYPPRDYCVQYNETNFEFITRLMQEWGINYHFEHTAGVHRLVWSDHNGAFQAASQDQGEGPGACHDIPYYPLGHKVDREYIHGFSPTGRITSGAYATRDHDYTRPRATLEASARDPRPTGHANSEIYAWRGAKAGVGGSDYSQPRAGSDKGADGTEEQGRQLAVLRMQNLRQTGRRGRGVGHVRAIVPGRTFTLSGHPQRARTVAFSLILTLIGFWAYGVLAVHFYRPQPMITLSGKTQTQCVGRYLIDVPIELGRLGSNSTVLTYGLTTDFDTVEMDVKHSDYTRAQFEKEVQARIDDIKGERTDWGTPTLLTHEVIETRYGRALMLRFLTHGFIESGITHELHALIGTRYVLLHGESYVPNPEPVTKQPWYKLIDPKPAEDRLRNVAMNIQDYTDATKAPEGFCVAGVVLNHKTMGYDIETAFFHSNADKEVLPDVRLTLNMQGQYAGHSEERENLFQRVSRQSTGLRALLAAEGGQLVVLRHATPRINGMPGREYGHAMHTLGGKVIFQFFAETALAKDQQSMLRPFFNFDFEAGSSMEEKTSPLDENQVLAIWDTLLTTMRLSPANGGNRIDGKTGALVPQTRVGEVCPRSGVWAASLPDTHPAARNLAIYHGRFRNVRAGDPMPTMFARFMFPQTADADNADITWSWVNQGSSA